MNDTIKVEIIKEDVIRGIPGYTLKVNGTIISTTTHKRMLEEHLYSAKLWASRFGVSLEFIDNT